MVLLDISTYPLMGFSMALDKHTAHFHGISAISEQG